MPLKIKNQIVLGVLLSIFGVYCAVIYLQPAASSVKFMHNQALAGEKLWQDNNCTACHQLYGLGGYLGPDLTNVASVAYKNETYLKAFLDGGIGAMPEFEFSAQEKDALIAFLRHVDSTGYYPLRNAVRKPSGWLEIQYK